MVDLANERIKDWQLYNCLLVILVCQAISSLAKQSLALILATKLTSQHHTLRFSFWVLSYTYPTRILLGPYIFSEFENLKSSNPKDEEAQGSPSPHQSLLFLLESCTSINKALQIQAQLLVSGLHRRRLFLSKLISFFSLASLPHSLLIFSTIRCPNAFVYNTLIRAHSLSPSPDASLSLYKSMLSSNHRTPPNNHTFPSLLASCSKLLGPELGRQVHCHVTKFGLDSDAHVRNSLIALYSGFGHLDTACKLFDEITQWDVVSFNVMIGGYNKGGRPADGLRAFADMVNLGVKPDRCTFACLMSVCSALGDLRSGKVVHVLALKNVGVNEFGDRLKIALVDMYVKLGAVRMADRVFSAMGAKKSSAAWIRLVSGYAQARDVEIARRLFDEMPEKDLISWTSMISGYSRIGRYKEALDLYEEMEKEGIKPHEVTLIPVLSACAHLGRLDLGKRLHRYVEDAVVSHNDSRLCTAIVDMYAKCGCIGTALEIFDRVDKKLKTTSLFNSMIAGLAQHGLGERAVALLEGMEALGLRPDKVTFVAVLCACSHSGLIEEGKKIFDSMVQKYGIHPQLEHYGCMVDLLGRRGYVDEAYDFIKNMPITPNFVIWSALLRNCRVHENARIGEIAERKLLQLGSNDSGSEGRCSRLVEMFLDTKSPQNAKKLRKMMNYKPVWKQQGWSYIEWNGSLHQFLADDVSHPQSKEIHLMLEEMMRRLRSAGLDVVSRHSERLALAFGLINLGPGETVRIVTDLRMCSDCHSSFKLLSKVFSREIAVRDKIRFHHMKNGSCSCLDSW